MSLRDLDKIDLYRLTSIEYTYFPEFDESSARIPLEIGRIPSHRNISEVNRLFVIKKESTPTFDIFLEAITAVIINRIVASKSYYFEENAIRLEDEMYSISLTPEVPYRLEGKEIMYMKLMGQNASQEVWEHAVDWKTIEQRPDQKMKMDDLQKNHEILTKAKAMHTQFMNDIALYGIKLDDHYLPDKQLMLKIDKNLKHFFFGVVDFEQRDSKTNNFLIQIVDSSSSLEEVIDKVISLNEEL